MTRRSRAIFGGLGVVAGVSLVAFEVGKFSASAPLERWFWLLVGALVAVLGAMSLFGDGKTR